MVAYELSPRSSRHLCTTPVASVGTADAINFRLFPPGQPPVGCWRCNPLLCKGYDAGPRQLQLERAKHRLLSYEFIGAYQPLNRLIGLRGWPPVRVTSLNGA